MQISVIIPTYNRKNLITRAIKSVINQSLKPFEIIIVDDGSTDGTYEFINQFFPEIRVIRQLNNGVSSARNLGLKNAKGNWIAFLDSDDEWFSKKLELQKKAIDHSDKYLISHTNEIWIRNGVRVNQMKKHQKYGGYIFEKSLDICRISPSSVLINRKIFEDIGKFDETLKICEDYDFWLRISSKYPVLFLDELLIKKYGGHKDQLSKNTIGIEQYRIQSLEKILKNIKLNKSQFNSAISMILKKLNIYKKGLVKRKKSEEIDIVQKKIDYWTNIVISN